MRITLPRNDLAHALTAVTRVVEPRNTIPILSNVLLSVTADTFTMKATDLDIEVSATMPAPLGAEQGATTVSATMLADIVKRATADVSLELSADCLVVKSGKAKYKLKTLPNADYPNLSAGPFTAEFQINLKSLVAPAQFAINPKDHRFFLVGTYLNGDETSITAVATDGHRLVRRVAPSVGAFGPIILPIKAASLIPDGIVTVRVSETKVQFENGTATVTSKLIDGTYPPYERLIPTDNDKVVVADRDALKNAAARVAVVSVDRGRGVRLDVSAGKVSLRMNGNAEGSDEIEADYDGEDVTVGFNVNYLADVAGVFADGNIRMALADGGSPALFTSDNDNGTICVLMPMRVN